MFCGQEFCAAVEYLSQSRKLGDSHRSVNPHASHPADFSPGVKSRESYCIARQGGLLTQNGEKGVKKLDEIMILYYGQTEFQTNHHVRA